MSNRILSVVSIVNLLGLSLFIAVYFYDKEKVVFIDSSKVINSYQGMIEARKAYQGKIAVWKSNIDTLSSEVRSEMVKYEKESPRMTPKEKELTQKLIQSKQQQLSEYQKAINEKAGQEDAEATKKVISEINAYIKVYGEENNYTIVLAATEYGNIAYAKEYLDITDKVIEGLNRKYTGIK